MGLFIFVVSIKKNQLSTVYEARSGVDDYASLARNPGK